ncbi:MAG: hypothetical protein IPP64_10105 [Bacteroidetes bacterium]|nr:hypothetical protein [Bacteroidota bacterium]
MAEFSTKTTKCASFTMIEDGIIHITLFENTEIDLVESKNMQQMSWSLTQGKPFVAMIDARVNIEVSKEAREWGSTPEAQKNMLAQAVLVNSIANKLVGNFIIKFHKPIAKTRLFSDAPAALEWLREQKRIADLK